MLCGLLFLAKPFVASFLPHFLSLDCCLATFSQKFCLLSGRVKRHSLHSLLSHLAHTVASTVELFNSTGFLTHIMIFLGNNYSLGIIIFMHVHFQFSFSNHYISIRISRVPSLRAYSSLIVISTKLYRAGTWPVGAPPLAHPHPHPTPPLAHPLCW